MELKQVVKQYQEKKAQMNRLEAKLETTNDVELIEAIGAELDKLDEPMFQLEDKLQETMTPLLKENGFTEKEIERLFLHKTDKACELAVRYIELTK